MARKSYTMMYDEALIAEANIRAERLGITRSAYINLALSSYMKQESLIDQMPQFYASVAELSNILKQAQIDGKLIPEKAD